MSTSSLKPYQSTDLRSLLKEMMWDITQHTLQLGKTVEAVANLLGKGQVEVTIVGPTSHTSLVTRLLENVGVQPVVQDFAVASTQTSYRGGSNDVAIVGMSGRFPGSESLEDFWTVIQKAQDLHKEVSSPRCFDRIVTEQFHRFQSLALIYRSITIQRVRRRTLYLLNMAASLIILAILIAVSSIYRQEKQPKWIQCRDCFL